MAGNGFEHATAASVAASASTASSRVSSATGARVVVRSGAGTDCLGPFEKAVGADRGGINSVRKVLRQAEVHRHAGAEVLSGDFEDGRDDVPFDLAICNGLGIVVRSGVCAPDLRA